MKRCKITANIPVDIDEKCAEQEERKILLKRRKKEDVCRRMNLFSDSSFSPVLFIHIVGDEDVGVPR